MRTKLLLAGIAALLLATGAAHATEFWLCGHIKATERVTGGYQALTFYTEDKKRGIPANITWKSSIPPRVPHLNGEPCKPDPDPQ